MRDTPHANSRIIGKQLTNSCSNPSIEIKSLAMLKTVMIAVVTTAIKGSDYEHSENDHD